MRRHHRLGRTIESARRDPSQRAHSITVSRRTLHHRHRRGRCITDDITGGLTHRLSGYAEISTSPSSFTPRTITLASVSSNVSGKVSGMGSFATARHTAVGWTRDDEDRAARRNFLPTQARSIDRITFSTLVLLLQRFADATAAVSATQRLPFQEKKSKDAHPDCKNNVFVSS